MKTIRIFSVAWLAVTSVWAAHYHPPHMDGIERYYQTKELNQWIETVPEELHPTLFAKEGAMDWWTG